MSHLELNLTGINQRIVRKVGQIASDYLTDHGITGNVQVNPKRRMIALSGIPTDISSNLITVIKGKHGIPRRLEINAHYSGDEPIHNAGLQSRVNALENQVEVLTAQLESAKKAKEEAEDTYLKEAEAYRLATEESKNALASLSKAAEHQTLANVYPLHKDEKEPLSIWLGNGIGINDLNSVLSRVLKEEHVPIWREHEKILPIS